MDLVKEEAAWEEEYVETLWAALYAGREARSQAPDIVTPVGRQNAVNTNVPQTKTEAVRDPDDVAATHSILKDASTNIIPKTEPVWTPEDTSTILEDATISNTLRTLIPDGIANFSTNQPDLEDSSSNNSCDVDLIQIPEDVSSTYSSLEDPTNKICKNEATEGSRVISPNVESASISNMLRTPVPISADVPTTQSNHTDLSNTCNTKVAQKFGTADTTNKICKTQAAEGSEDSSNVEGASISNMPRTPAPISTDLSTIRLNPPSYTEEAQKSSSHTTEVTKKSSIDDTTNKICKTEAAQDSGDISPDLEDASNMPNKEAAQGSKDISISHSNHEDANKKIRIDTACNPMAISTSLQDPSVSKTCTEEAARNSEPVSSTFEEPIVTNELILPKTEPISLKSCYIKLEHVTCKKAFVCQVCQRIFSYNHKLMKHILSHTQEEINTIKIEKKVVRKRKFECHLCGRGYDRKTSLNRHYKVHQRNPLTVQLYTKTPEDTIKKIYYTCDYCGMSTVRKRSLYKHMMMHAKECLVCDICKMQFKAAWELVEHVKRKTCKQHKAFKECSNERNTQDLVLKSCYVSVERMSISNERKTAIIEETSNVNSESEDLLDGQPPLETDEETYYCGVCEVQFETLASMGDHVCERPKKPLSCNICSKKFRFESALFEHYRLHTGEKPFTCDVCKKTFRLKNCMKLHIRTVHLGQNPFSCKFCKKKFRCTTTLRKHVSEHTGEKEKKRYSCKVCKKKFRFENECVEHGRVHTGEKPFTCTVCNMRFRVEVSLRIHSRVHTGERPYSCDVCKRSFRIWQTLDAHKRVHTGEKPFQCDVCHKSFRRYDTVRTHKRIHTGEKPYACEFCSKRFRQRSHLKSHQKIHTGEKSFSCTICNKKFAEVHQLKNHGRIHTGEKPYSCNVCGKAFRESQGLKTHYRKHTGEKPYECPVCKKQCSQSSNLRTHMKTHGKKSWPFACNICEKKFQSRKNLNQHLVLHDAHTPFMCDVCGAQFRSSSVLAVHARSHYGGE